MSLVSWEHKEIPIQFEHLRSIEEEYWPNFQSRVKAEDRDKQRTPTKWHLYTYYPPQSDITDRLILEVAPVSYVTWASACRAEPSADGQYPGRVDQVTVSKEGRKRSLRLHYGRGPAIAYQNRELPSILFTAMLIVGPDRKSPGHYFILGQNSPNVHEEYADSWSASFEEVCDRTQDDTPFETARRGLEEEFNIPREQIKHIRFLSLSIEQPDLSTGLLGIIEINMSFEEVLGVWKGRRDREQVCIVEQLLTKEHVTDLLDAPVHSHTIGSQTHHGPWHPSSKMRMILGLGAYGRDISDWCPSTITRVSTP